MLHYNPRHVSSSTMLIFRSSNCIITASGIVTFCKRPYSKPVESGMQSVPYLKSSKLIQSSSINSVYIYQLTALLSLSQNRWTDSIIYLLIRRVIFVSQCGKSLLSTAYCILSPFYCRGEAHLYTETVWNYQHGFRRDRLDTGRMFYCYYYLSGCTMFPHLPAPIEQL